MDGVGISIIERPRPLPGHDTPNPTEHPYTLKCEEPANRVLLQHRGWFETGDIAVIRKGFIWMADQDKVLILSGCFTVYRRRS